MSLFMYICYINKSAFELLAVEVSILKSLDHENIVRCIDDFRIYDYAGNAKEFLIVMELVEGGTVM